MLDRFIYTVVLYTVIIVLWLDRQKKAKGQRITGRAWKGFADNIEERRERLTL